MVIGSTISHYRIVEKLGEGGMGVVYKAEDTSLERPVALKFLAEHLLNDEEAKQRFLREAKAAAALHHPNICPVYEISEDGGKTFISMAFIEGETLEDKIARGPVSIKEALEISQQVAKGLNAAHEKGIVHRDVKPANILVASDGQATIMDFGLARLSEASRLTKKDTAMGTVAYMSPEQAQGAEVDHRADIWALGCVLYEMVAGLRPFQGEYDQALFYEIVQQEPVPLTSIRAGVPMELEFIVSKCLAKDPDDRYNAADELAKDLRTLGEKLKSGRSTILRTEQMTGAVQAHPAAGATLKPIVVPPSRSQRVWQAVAAVSALFAIVLAFAYFQAPEPPTGARDVRRFSFTHPGVAGVSISPDGRHIVFGAPDEDGQRKLWLRSLEDETVRAIDGTQEALQLVGGWSPDSRSVLFAADGQLKRVSIDGGSPVALCALPGTGTYPFLGATYSLDGARVVFSSGTQLWEIPARGGEPNHPFEPEPGAAYWAPVFLPKGDGSRYVMYSIEVSGGEGWTEVFDRETGEHRKVAAGQPSVYSRGFVVHGTTRRSEPGLFATPFSLETLSPTGDAFPLSLSEGGMNFSVSDDGTLVFTDGIGGATHQIAVRDRDGEIIQYVGDRIPLGAAPAVSPDGRLVAISVAGVIWVYDLDRNVRIRLTPDSGGAYGTSWLPSGREVSFSSNGRYMVRSADASSDARVLFDSPGSGRASFSPDGRYVAYNASGTDGEEGGIWYREAAPDGSFSEPISWLRTPANENQAQISPNGRYLAYRSDESGRDEVYVRPFPEGRGQWLISTNGGQQPQWSSDGSELFYLEGPALMAAVVSTGPEFAVGEVTRLFESRDFAQNGLRFAAFPDGQRFATIQMGSVGGNAVRIVENWDAPYRNGTE